MYEIGRARWGASGTLYSQSAIARLNSFPRVDCVEPILSKAVLTAGSHADGRREPGQAGNGAAISVSASCCGSTRLELAVAANSATSTRRKVHGHF